MSDVNVTQAARDALADYYAIPGVGDYENGVAERVREGLHEDPLLRAFARFERDTIARLNAQTPEPATQQPRAENFQAGVDKWMDACFGDAIKADQLERADRFCEEALELCQTMPGFNKARAHALVDYVFDRPQGEINQEVGGVMVTLAALCNTTGTDIAEAAATELARVWTKVEAIRAKQAAKPTGSALPVATQQPRADVVEALREAVNAAEVFVDGGDLAALPSFEQWLPKAKAILALRTQAPASDEVIPREPTEAMLDAAWHLTGESKEMRARVHHRYRRYWQAMFDAALGAKP